MGIDYVVKVMDGEMVYGAGVDTYTSSAFNRVLGQSKQFSLLALADNVSGTGTIVVQAEHSPDERNWTNVNSAPEINGGAINASANNLLAGSHTGSAAVLGPFVRFRIRMTTSTAARLTITVTGRSD